MGDVNNIKIGARRVIYNGVDLGHTQGGCTVNYAPEYADLMADQFGNTPVDKALLGEQVTVTVPLTEYQVSKLKAAIPNGTVTGGTNSRMTFGSNAGKRLLTGAAELILRPLGATTHSVYDVVFHKAASFEEIELGFNNEDQTIIEVNFLAMIDQTKSDGNWLGFLGDSAD